VRILFMTQRLPYAPNRGDRLRAYQMLRVLRESATVDVVSLVHDREEAAHASDLAALADRVLTLPVPRLRNLARAVPALATSTPLTHVLLDSPGAAAALGRFVSDRRPDVVLAYCSSMARFAFEPPLAGLPTVVDLVDVDSAKWLAMAASSRWPMSAVYARESRVLSAFERTIAGRAAATLVVNARERDALRCLGPDADAIVLENGVDTSYFAPPAPVADPVVVFSGVMDYAPNEQGALWMATQVWPLVRRAVPAARLVLAGAAPGPTLTALPARDPSVTVTGSVPSIREYLWGAAVAVAPLTIARGVQNKVIEAVAAGLPCVITSAVAEGVPDEITPACRVGDDVAAFATHVIDLLRLAPAVRRTLASRADVSVLDWASRMRALVPILEAAAGRGVAA
jgi:polysaccharide biosynthesis protein PslH